MNSFELSYKAKEDLKNIARYTNQKWGTQKRNQYIKALDECFQQLANNPLLAINAELINKGYYKYIKNSHVIYFIRKSKTHIRVTRILHKKMDVHLQI